MGPWRDTNTPVLDMIETYDAKLAAAVQKEPSASAMLISPHIAQEQPVNVSGRPLDMLLPSTSHKGTVHRQQHLRPMAHALRKSREREIYEQRNSLYHQAFGAEEALVC
ncbi:MAG: hypothetical protein FRX49_00385 [Trebouxia sp. A1-2]|nr:MAG: hypothetical protein FRX49_00385 [Trebouxia sp. A1-2]